MRAQAGGRAGRDRRAWSTTSRAELKPPLDKYVESLPKMQSGIESYAEKLKTRGAVKDVDQSIQEVGGAFSADVTPESVAFEKFLVCAIPDLDKKKDIQGVLEFLADACKKDPVPFMTKVRADCGPLVQNVDKDAQAGAVEDVQGQRQEVLRGGRSASCRPGSTAASARARARRCSTSRSFLTAAGDYMEARGELVQTAKETAARITGQPLPSAKEGSAAGRERKEGRPRRRVTGRATIVHRGPWTAFAGRRLGVSSDLMRGKVVEQVVESSPTDRNVQVRSLLMVTAVGVLAIAGAIAVTTYRNAAARARRIPPRPCRLADRRLGL